MSAVAPDRPAVVITGAASGIGAATAAHFIAQGWNVLLGYFGDVEREAALAIAATAQAGVRVVATQLDVTRDDQCRTAAALAIDSFGGIDALISSAGTTRIVAHRDLDALGLDDFERTSRVNTVGPF